LKLFWEHELEQSGDYQLIQIARIEKRGAGVNLSQDYIPPCPMIAGSESLLNLIGEIRDQVTARSRQLEEYKKKRSVHSAEFGSRDMVYILALRSVNRYVPLLHHYTKTPKIHPWVVYGVMRQLIGELSSFSDRVNSLGEFSDHDHAFPEYDHSRLWDCYFEIQNLISHLLDEITAGPEYIMRFIPDGVFYSTDLKPTVFQENKRFYLSVRTDDEASSVIQTVTTLAKLGSREDLKHIVARALPGIHLEHQPQPPQQLPRRSNAIYFLIHHHSEQWESVVKNRNIALYWNNAPGDADIELVVIRRSHAPK
jgi:type VI secretion system protein ImpJ